LSNRPGHHRSVLVSMIRITLRAYCLYHIIMRVKCDEAAGPV
jgi:hypothetical protein